MKKISTFLILISIAFASAKAQKPVVITEDSLLFGKSKLPGITITVPEVGYEKFLKAWTRELQSGTKSKLVTDKNDMSIFGARIKLVSPDPLNVYSHLQNVDTMLRLSVSFELKKDVYVERATGETGLNSAKLYLKEFVKSQYLNIAKDQADAEDKKLRDLEKELSSLEKDKSRLQKQIQSDNNDIISEKDNITIQTNELNTVSASLVDLNSQLSTLEEGPAKKEKADSISALEKRKKKALNSIENSQNRINKYNTEIDKANAEIPKNEMMQSQASEKIARQQAVYQKFADKVKTIKAY